MRVRKITEGYADARAGLIALPIFEGGAHGPAFRTIDAALDGALTRIVREEHFTRRDGNTLLVHTHGRVAAGRVLLVGVSRASDWPEPPARLFANTAVREARRRRVARIALVWPFEGERGDTARDAEELLLGVLLANYGFDRYRTDDKDENPPVRVEDVTLCVPKAMSRRLTSRVLETAERRAGVRAGAVCRARDLVNTPPNDLTPGLLAAAARAIAAGRPSLNVTVLERAQLEEQGFGLLLAVGQGAAPPPVLVHVRYEPPDGAAEGAPVVAIVGKGITFDSGGLDIKTRGNMVDMKCDMAGAAAVLSTMAALAELAPRVRVHGIVPSAENMLGPASYRPGDVLRSLNGKTVEVANTDAEGRLALADALTYAVREGAEEIVDLATLTGACAVALGEFTAGLFSNCRALADRLLKAAREAGESLWELPVDRRLLKEMKSSIADLKNIGGRYGGAIHGALFLEEFVEKHAWAHLDIAGPAYVSHAEQAVPKDGTGYGVLTLLRWLEDL